MLKRVLVGTGVGRLAEHLRDRQQILSFPKESLGSLANDQLATQLVTQICNPERVFLDIGAHIGSIIAGVLHSCPGTKIVAVEAIPEKAEKLSQKFKNIDIRNCALSDFEGTTKFYVDTEQSGFSSLSQPPHSFREIEVPVAKLDGLSLTDIDVIKIDVEGAELGVLRGGVETIRKCQPIIMFESGPGEVLGYKKADMWQWFTDNSYAIFAPNRLAHTAKPMTLEIFLDSHSYPRVTTNYFAVHDTRIEDARNRARAVLSIKPD